MLAWLLIFQPIALTWAQTFGSGFELAQIKSQLATLFYVPLAHVGWLALSGHGLAGFFAPRS